MWPHDFASILNISDFGILKLFVIQIGYEPFLLTTALGMLCIGFHLIYFLNSYDLTLDRIANLTKLGLIGLCTYFVYNAWESKGLALNPLEDLLPLYYCMFMLSIALLAKSAASFLNKSQI